jgi:predicted regulator of Ras-like GTPase activity (Roadblock/LC7/MglB family)
MEPHAVEPQLSNGLLQRFAGETAGVTEAMAVSSDGLLIAASRAAADSDTDRMSAIVSGMTSLANAAAETYQYGAPTKVIVDMPGGFLVIAAIGVGAVLAIAASGAADLGTIAYEMTVFANRARTVLTPQLIVELKNSVHAV